MTMNELKMSEIQPLSSANVHGVFVGLSHISGCHILPVALMLLGAVL